jgi:hypothetical protein
MDTVRLLNLYTVFFEEAALARERKGEGSPVKVATHLHGFGALPNSKPLTL